MVSFEQDGLSLGTDVLYETVRIPYGTTRKRTYIVDFLIPARKLLIEVKPSHRVDSKHFRAKRKAALAYAAANDLSYLIVTEVELKGHTILLEETPLHPDVVLDDRSRRALTRKQRRRAKKKR